MNLSRRGLLQSGLGSALGLGLLGRASPFAFAADAPAKKPAAAPAKPATKPAANPYADAVFVKGPPPMPAKGSFTIAVMPDTQHYEGKNVPSFHAQTKWIAEQQADRRIAAVLHLGDITNNNRPGQWTIARDAMARLDGRVPYFMVPGNHDYSNGGTSVDRDCGMSKWFPAKTFADRTNFGGFYDKEPDRTENSYHTFDAGGRKFGVICLEWAPRGDVVRWANEVATKLADRELILTTHAYMYYDETRYDWKARGAGQSWNPHKYGLAAATNHDVNDGQELWDKLVSRHGNFILTLNGHVLNDGLGRLVSATPGGRDVSQVLVNFQMKPNGGDGWLRMLEFKPDGRTIEVRDYSPTLDRMNESKQNRFDLRTAPLKSA